MISSPPSIGTVGRSFYTSLGHLSSTWEVRYFPTSHRLRRSTKDIAAGLDVHVACYGWHPMGPGS